MPPTEAATAMRIVTVVDLVFEDADCTCGVAVLDAVEDIDWMLVIVDATTLAVGMRVVRVGVIFADVWEVGEVDEDEDEAFDAVEEDKEDEEGEAIEVLWEEVTVDATPVEVEMAEVTEIKAKDEEVVGEVSDAVDWEVAIWESEFAKGKGKFRSWGARFLKRIEPWRRLKESSWDWTSDGMVIKI